MAESNSSEFIMLLSNFKFQWIINRLSSIAYLHSNKIKQLSLCVIVSKVRLCKRRVKVFRGCVAVSIDRLTVCSSLHNGLFSVSANSVVTSFESLSWIIKSRFKIHFVLFVI